MTCGDLATKLTAGTGGDAGQALRGIATNRGRRARVTPPRMKLAGHLAGTNAVCQSVHGNQSARRLSKPERVAEAGRRPCLRQRARGKGVDAASAVTSRACVGQLRGTSDLRSDMGRALSDEAERSGARGRELSLVPVPTGANRAELNWNGTNVLSVVVERLVDRATFPIGSGKLRRRASPHLTTMPP